MYKDAVPFACKEKSDFATPGNGKYPLIIDFLTEMM